MDCMVFIRTPGFSRTGALKKPIMSWIRRWGTPGEFEMTIPLRSDIDYDTILSKCTEAGFVRSIVRETDDEEGDLLTIEGPSLAGYALQRIVWGAQTITGTPEAIMKELVTRNMGSGADVARQFAGLTVEASQGLSGASRNYQATDVPLLDELEALSKDSGLGFDIVVNGLGMKFRVLEGLDRTAGQSVNPRAIFSIERKNLLSAEFEQNGNKFTNVAKISNDLYTEVFGTATGYQRYETFVNPSSVEKDEDGVANSEATQRALLLQQGEQKLTPMTLCFTVRIDPYGNLKYKTNYDLGDVCTCQVKRWNVSLDARITEIKEIYTVEGLGLEVTFGTGLLTYGQLRRIING